MKILALFSGLLISSISFAQGVNSVSILPNNPTSSDTIYVVSNFTYYGDCATGLLNYGTIYQGNNIIILPEYCGPQMTVPCTAIDTFYLGVLPAGNYSIELEYHYGNICAGSNDVILATYNTAFDIGTLSLQEFYLEDKELMKITDLLGREVTDRPNTYLIYVYKDGTKKKVYRIEN
jgi:hypothetical protein